MYKFEALATERFNSTIHSNIVRGLNHKADQDIREFITTHKKYIEKNPAFLALYRIEFFYAMNVGDQPICHIVGGCNDINLKTGFSNWLIYGCLPNELEETKQNIDNMLLPRANTVGNKIHMPVEYISWCLENDLPSPNVEIGEELEVIASEHYVNNLRGVTVRAKSGDTYTIPWINLNWIDLRKNLPATPTSRLDEATLISRAEQAYSVRDFKQAISYFSHLIERNSENWDAYSRRGDAKDELGDIQGALKDYDQALQINPRDAETLNNRALVKWKKLEKYESAIEDYEKSLSFRPNYALAHAGYAQCLLRVRDFEAALSKAEKAIEIDPRLPLARDIRAQIYSMGLFTTYTMSVWQESSADPSIAELQAQAHEDWALTRSPVSSESANLIEIATNCLTSEDMHSTLLYSNLAIFHDNKNSDAYMLRGLARGFLHYFTDAFHDFSEAVKLDASNYLAFYHRGRLLAQFDKHIEAIKDFSSAIDTNPQHIDSLLHRGLLTVKLGQSPVEDMTHILEQEPRHLVALTLMATHMSITDEHQEVIRIANLVLEIHEDPYIYELRAESFLALDKFKHAYQDYTKLIEIDHDSDVAYYKRGELNLKRKNYALAIQDFTDAIEKPKPPNQNYGLSFVMRGKAYLLNGDERLGHNDLDHAIQNEYYPLISYDTKAKFYLLKSNWREAHKFYGLLVKKAPNRVEGYEGRVQSILKGAKDHLFLIDQEELFSDIDKVMELQPTLANKYAELKTTVQNIMNS